MKFKALFNYVKSSSSRIISIYLLLVGAIWICLHLYLRLSLGKQSYTLADIKPFLTIKHYMFFTGLLILQLIFIIIAIIVIYHRLVPRKKNSIFLKLSEKVTYIIDFVYWKPLEYVHDLIAPNIPILGSFFFYVEKTWSPKNPIYFYTLIFLFEVLPRLLIALIFFIEIIIFGQIKIFIYSISLIFVTIIWQIFLKMFASFGLRNKHVIEDYFYPIKGVGDPILDQQGNIISYKSLEFIVKPEYDGVINVEEEARLLLQLEAMPRFVERLKKDTLIVLPYITTLTSFIYIIGGTYRLVFLIT